MNEIKKENTLLVKKELEEMLGIIISLKENKDSCKLLLGINCYFILIAIEAVNYVEKEINKSIQYKYKNQLKSSRARLKPYTNSYNEIYESIKNINISQYKYFSTLCNPIAVKRFPYLIDNLGITLYKGKIIDNTFLNIMDNKKIITHNSSLNSEKTFNIAKELGSLISKTLEQINGEKKEISLNIQSNITFKDYNTYFQENALFVNNIDVNCCLLLLNILCPLNYYTYIIKKFNISSSLKYRFAYIIFCRSYNNLIEILKNNKLILIEKIIKKYDYLNNKNFRNKIFHYDIHKLLQLENYNKNEIYLGLIKQELQVSQVKFMKDIDEYFIELADIIEKAILKGGKIWQIQKMYVKN